MIGRPVAEQERIAKAMQQLGMEWGVTRNVSVKVEGLFLAFDKDFNVQDIGSEGDQGDFFRMDDGFVARIGLNWRPYLFF